jgi:hypothetical protein
MTNLTVTWRTLCTSCLCLVFAAVCGCSQDQTAKEVAAKNDSNIKRVANLYSGYQYTHAWQGPKDLQALKDFAKNKGLPDQNLRMMGIDPDHVEAIFVSERDGKPFEVRNGVTGGPGAVEALVFEDNGVDGKRLVAFNGGFVEEADAPRYKELWDGHGGGPTGTTVNKRPESPPMAVPPPSAKESQK